MLLRIAGITIAVSSADPSLVPRASDPAARLAGLPPSTEDVGSYPRGEVRIGSLEPLQVVDERSAHGERMLIAPLARALGPDGRD